MLARQLLLSSVITNYRQGLIAQTYDSILLRFHNDGPMVLSAVALAHVAVDGTRSLWHVELVGVARAPRLTRNCATSED